MKWLYVHLPHFYAESSIPEFRINKPIAVVNEQRKILDCNKSAESYGISSDTSLTSAFCLCPDLQTYKWEQAQLQLAQNRIAKIAGRFTSWISIDNERGVFLEIASMKRLFGSTRNLHQALCRLFEKHNYTTKVAAAPNPAAARILAQAGYCHSVKLQQLEIALEDIPACFLGISPTTEYKLLKMGINTLGDLHKIDRSELAQRIDAETTNNLAMVYNQKPWLPQPYSHAITFADKIDLEQEFESLTPLRFILAQRLTQFCKFLHKRQLLCQELHLLFSDREGHQHTEKLALACPENRAEPWHFILNSCIERWQLSKPVVQIKLSAHQFIQQSAPALDLFSDPQKADKEQSKILFNRLSTKLGPQALRFISCSNDPRPEKNTQLALNRPTTKNLNKPINFEHQPIWLYQNPLPMRYKPEIILHGPARIETGWWDQTLQQRDYYITRNSYNAVTWVYREKNGACFEQGIFG